MNAKHYRLHGVDVWIYPDDLERGDAALMPTPTHDQDSFGMGTSYAHLFGDEIMQFSRVIGHRSDLKEVDP